MKKTAPTEVGGCMMEGGQEAILEILVDMKKAFKLILVRRERTMKRPLVVLVVFLGAAVAYAAPMCTEVSLPFGLTSDGWAEGCVLGDKLFDAFTYDPGTTGLATVNVNFAEEPTLNQHSVLFSGGGGYNWTVGTFAIQYSVTVLNPLESWKIVAAEFDTTIGGTSFGTVATKNLTDGDQITYLTLTSTDGNPDLKSLITPLRNFRVEMSATIGSGMSMTQLADNYYQADTAIPEPMTGVLLGCGLLALGLTRRRRRS